MFKCQQFRDQARGQNEAEDFLILGKSFCPSFIHAYIFLPQFRGQFHKTIYDVVSSQKDRTMFLHQNLRFMKIKKFTKFSLFGANLRS